MLSGLTDKAQVAGMQVAHRRNDADAFAHALPFFGELLHRGDGGDDSHTGKVSVETRPINAIVGFVMLMKYAGSPLCGFMRRPPHGLSDAGIILFE